MKFMISMDDELFERVNDFAKSRHISRSALMTLSVTQYMDAIEALPGIKGQIDDLRKVLDDMSVGR